MSRIYRGERLERLVDADPAWAGDWLVFECPIHEDCGNGGNHLGIPVDPTPSGEKAEGRAWKRSGGDGFDAVTVAPSIRMMGTGGGCAWHGFIRDGGFIHCGDSE